MPFRSVALIALFLGACNRTPEPSDAGPSDAGPSDAGPSDAGPSDAGPSDAETPFEPPAGEPSAPDTPATGGSSAGGEPNDAPDADSVCTVPLTEPPAPVATPVESCPEDPAGRPSMPIGSVTFLDAEDPLTVDVELAITDAHRQHGLMFRDHLPEDEGMLFTFEGSDVRTFWMRNTCIPLDMLFIDDEGYISGILEQVPPWNDERRSVNCRVRHVLEMRAGWTREHSVLPGQRVTIGSPATD